ncbi:exported protein of unknown function (plasmid) [Streptomyces ambofaciens ATCC 23877]|uniref:Uncharacterized protein n=1 Tax=Streptomyces ambofaciens (strain ATCC 23877 / 3486 / DSM 40053 / JCM 4204 / NBRC 12836 / NRRL B-2516) TaxID=278992 RepID=A0A0K2B685_STRA7|nr:hypothetical protein [Streptomyces ambofaciens]AKZ60743.1 exported protein of unknown function [Streptomyces ambofaciens ATCC 23877]
MSGETKTFGTVGVIAWLITAVAAVDMALGNPSAINGVIGAGVGAAAFTWMAWTMHREDELDRPQPVVPRVDLNRIAVLEHELLGITPEPGTPAAHAVARAQPVDPAACPHDDVIDVTEMGQARDMGLCERCGAGMVADDEGGWQRP